MATHCVPSPCSLNTKPRLWQKSEHSIIKEIIGNKLNQPVRLAFLRGYVPGDAMHTFHLRGHSLFSSIRLPIDDPSTILGKALD